MLKTSPFKHHALVWLEAWQAKQVQLKTNVACGPLLFYLLEQRSPTLPTWRTTSAPSGSWWATTAPNVSLNQRSPTCRTSWTTSGLQSLTYRTEFRSLSSISIWNLPEEPKNIVTQFPCLSCRNNKPSQREEAFDLLHFQLHNSCLSQGIYLYI